MNRNRNRNRKSAHSYSPQVHGRESARHQLIPLPPPTRPRQKSARNQLDSHSYSPQVHGRESARNQPRPSSPHRSTAEDRPGITFVPPPPTGPRQGIGPKTARFSFLLLPPPPTGPRRRIGPKSQSFLLPSQVHGRSRTEITSFLLNCPPWDLPGRGDERHPSMHGPAEEQWRGPPLVPAFPHRGTAGPSPPETLNSPVPTTGAFPHTTHPRHLLSLPNISNYTTHTPRSPHSPACPHSRNSANVKPTTHAPARRSHMHNNNQTSLPTGFKPPGMWV